MCVYTQPPPPFLFLFLKKICCIVGEKPGFFDVQLKRLLAIGFLGFRKRYRAFISSDVLLEMGIPPFPADHPRFRHHCLVKSPRETPDLKGVSSPAGRRLCARQQAREFGGAATRRNTLSLFSSTPSFPLVRKETAPPHLSSSSYRLITAVISPPSPHF